MLKNPERASERERERKFLLEMYGRSEMPCYNNAALGAFYPPIINQQVTSFLPLKLDRIFFQQKNLTRVLWEAYSAGGPDRRSKLKLMHFNSRLPPFFLSLSRDVAAFFLFHAK